MASSKVCIWCLPFLLLVLIGIYSVSNPLVCQNAIAQDNYARQSLPNTAEEWLKFGDQELAAGKVLPVIDACKEAIRIEPGYEPAYHRLAYLLGIIGSLSEQIDVLSRIIQLTDCNDGVVKLAKHRVIFEGPEQNLPLLKYPVSKPKGRLPKGCPF